MRSSIVVTLVGLVVVLVAVLLRSVLDPFWLLIPGMAVATSGFRSMIVTIGDRHGQRQVPSWLGIAILLVMAAIIPVLMLAKWLNGP